MSRYGYSRVKLGRKGLSQSWSQNRNERNQIFQKVYHHLLLSNNWTRFILLILIFVPPIYLILFSSGVSSYWSGVAQSKIKLIYLDTLKDLKDNKEYLQGKWNVSGWEYHGKLESILQSYKVTGEDVMHGRIHDGPNEVDNLEWAVERHSESMDSTGFWIYGQKSDNPQFKESDRNVDQIKFGKQKFRSFGMSKKNENQILLSNFQDEDDPSKVSLGFALYMEGQAEMKITISYKGQKKQHFKRIRPLGKFFNLGFCNEIFTIPPEIKVDEIKIQAHVGSKDSFVIIDKVFATLGNSVEQSKTLIYTIFPYNWCQSKGEKANKIIHGVNNNI